MSAAALIVSAASSGSLGLVAGWFARRAQLVAQIRELEAEREEWRGIALDSNAKALGYRRERDRCRSFLKGVFGEVRQ